MLCDEWLVIKKKMRKFCVVSGQSSLMYIYGVKKKLKSIVKFVILERGNYVFII